MFEKNTNKTYDLLNQTVKCIAILSLIVAYTIGNQQTRNRTEKKIQENLPGKTIVKIETNPDVYKIIDPKAEQMEGWLIITQQQGWGGPLDAGIYINDQARIENLYILNHRETPAFFDVLVNQNYFGQYPGKSVQDLFKIESDIDGVSGATISSRAIAEAVRQGAHFWGRSHFDLAIEEPSIDWQVGSNEFILIILYAVIVISALKKYRKIRYLTMAFSIVFLGFYLSMPISVSAFGSLLMGYSPPFSGYLFWWLLLFGAILMALITGKNLYCSWACPFGGMQEIISKIGGISLKVNSTINRMANKIVAFLFWLSFMIMFLTNNPANGAFEPFAVLFSFKGLGVQWYLVSIAIIGSFIIPRFWCRFFCPVGFALKTIARTKKRITQKFTIKPGMKSEMKCVEGENQHEKACI